MHVLGHLSVEQFLRDYWQKKPVLIRNAWPEFEPLMPADELAGLSLEQEIESRLIIEDGIANDSDGGPWQLKCGPFTEEDFRLLPDDKWTLLIQGVDQWIPEAADLLEHFRFIPSWRIDDLMISYAVDGGNVGPHYDQYDVFLLQAEGQREWSVGQLCSEHSPFIEGPKIRILEEFNETDCWVLNPGDMLYLPPLFAHHGVARGECMTYSIGFRAPSQLELAQAALDELLVSASEDKRYQDPDQGVQKHSSEIDSNAAERLRSTLNSALADEAVCQRILGKLMTEAKYPEHRPESIDELSWSDIERQLNTSGQLRKSEFARFAFGKASHAVEFFYQGQSLIMAASELPLIEQLCDANALNIEAILRHAVTQEARNLLTTLFRQQLLYTED